MSLMPPAARVIPAPTLATPGAGVWRVPARPRVTGPEELAEVLARFADDARSDTGLDPVVTGESEAEIRVALDATGLDELPTAAGARADGRDGADERYGLTVTQAGALVRGGSPEAIHRGLTTLRQLLIAAAGDLLVPAVEILDGPRFAWRGLSLDVVRTFHDVETVERVIDMCALHKLNVLHLHLTDDQGWRLEVPGWPLLTEVGGAGAIGDRPGGFYPLADVAGLVDYAARRFVTIVPEIDMPGHTGAVFKAYPDLAPEPTLAAEQGATFGMPIGVLDLDRGRTRAFVADVIAAAVAQFPTSAYIHVGGDEAFGMPDEAHAAFVEYAVTTVKEQGRKALGWQEIARAAIGESEIVQYWIEPGETEAMLGSDILAASMPSEIAPLFEATMRASLQDLPRALARGSRILVSLSPRLYFDRPHGDPGADAAQEARRIRLGLPVYPPATLRAMVEWDPVTATPGVERVAQLAGVEAALWCETVTDREDLEALLLPRLAGAGERAWSVHPTIWDDYVSRLAVLTPAWDRRGWAWFRPAFLAPETLYG